MREQTDIESALRQFADKRQAAIYQRFFKTGPGEYGEGDCFLGVTNPNVRLVVREAWKRTTTDDAAELARSQWHEVRLCAQLILVAQFEQAYKNRNADTMQHIVERYLLLHPYINNWDLVDLSAYKIIGRYEMLYPEWTLMDEWILPNHTLWQQRIAMVATWWHAHEGIYDRLVSRAETLLTSKHDLLHKASGWMLREMYKHDDNGKETLESFLKLHVAEMPSVMLSYAMEKMPEAERKQWRTRRRQ